MAAPVLQLVKPRRVPAPPDPKFVAPCAACSLSFFDSVHRVDGPFFHHEFTLVPLPDFQLTPPMHRPRFHRAQQLPGSKPKPRQPRKAPVSLNDEELLALLAKARSIRPRDWVVIVVTYWHGLRANEACMLCLDEEASLRLWPTLPGYDPTGEGGTPQPSYFDVQAGEIHIFGAKGSNDCVQALQEHENPLLNEKAAVEWWFANRGLFGVKGGAKQGYRAREKRPGKRQQSTEIVAFSPTQDLDPDLQPVSEAGSAGDPEPHPDPSALAGGQKNAEAGENFEGMATDDDRLFPIHRSHFWKVVHRYALAVGIARRKCKSHTLKHTIAKHLVREGASIDELMGWLRWKSLETPLWYLRPNEDELSDRVGSIIRKKAGFRSGFDQGRLF